MNEQQTIKLEVAKLATQLTEALLQSGRFDHFAQDIRTGPNQAPPLFQVFDAIFDHLERKSVP